MSNRPNGYVRRVYAWMIGNAALLQLGRVAKETQGRRRDDEAAAKKDGKRVDRPYSPTRAEREARKSKVW